MMNTIEESKTARIGPMRAQVSDQFAPSRNNYDDTKKEDKAEQQRAKIILPASLEAQLRCNGPSDYEKQNVLTYTVETYSTQMRLEYMAFVEDKQIEHCWLGLLTWWNHRHHDKESQYKTIFEEKLRIEAFNGVEKVMGVARVFKPTGNDTEVVSSIMRDHMTTSYRYQFEQYLRKYAIPKCLRVLKLWLWDVQDGRQSVPDKSEDADTRACRIRQLLTIAHKYDGVSKFPRLARNFRRHSDERTIDAVRKRSHQQQQQQLSPSKQHLFAHKIQKIELLSDDEDAGEQVTTSRSITPPPPPPGFEPVTPPPPPPPPEDDNEDDRPARVSRPPPSPPRDPRVQHYPQSSLLQPSLTTHREVAGRSMGFDSYIIKHVVRNMSEDDWVEFIANRRYGMSLIKELQIFLNEKYCHEEYTETQEHYGQLCNIAAYPACYGPYEMDMSAKQNTIGDEGERWRRTPKTFYQREFAGSAFPVYMTEEEYDSRFFNSHMYSIDDHSDPRGYYTYTKYPCMPSQRMLCTRNSKGKVVPLRNMPRRDEEE